MSYSAAKSIRVSGLRALLPARSQLVTHIPYTRSMRRCASTNQEILGNGFLQASSKTHQPTKAMRGRVTQEQATSNSNRIGLQYDAISGRMVPSDSQSSVACSPGSELDALLRSKTNQTVDPTSNTIECTPGNELEAKFIADPASRSDQSLPSELNNQWSNASFSVTMDCPPGNEVEVKLTAELGGLGFNPSGSLQTKIGPQSSAFSRRSIDCSPGSELEAHILSQSAERQSIDCSPGYEVEANFISNPDSAEYRQFQPPMTETTDPSKRANINIDCPPGSELEALFIADSASSKDSKTEKGPISFDTSEDRVGDFIAQHQTPALEHEAQSSVSQKPSPEFRILSFDASTSQVSTANADLFFGAQEDARTNDILSRLHTPAKFLPHLEKMQMDGYEIATGGGDILVFRKIHDSHLPPKTAKQNSSVHAEIVKHLRHDSIDPTASHQRASRLSTTEPHSITGSCTSNPEAHTKSRTSFRDMIRRMIFAGTATAVTCYAIGVVTEFFRTGGNYERGADGFTVLESDRRHRD